jgi:hypothetical protein
MALDTATLDFDESSPFQLRERAKALAQGQPEQSEPVPGIAHGSIPGLLGVALNDQVRAARASMGDRPTSFADRFGASGGSPGPAPVNGAPPMPAPAAAGAVPPLGPPVNVGPPPGASAGSAAPPPLPAPAAPAVPQGQPPSTPAVPPQDNSLVPKDSLIGRMLASANNWRDQNRLTLLAMAGGLAGSQSIGQGLGRAFSAAVPAQQADIKLNQQNQTEQALIAKGVHPDIAKAAASNPTIMQQIIPQLFGAKQKKFTQVGEDMFGNKKYGFVDEVTGAVTPFEGSSPFGGGGGAGGGNVNSDLKGDEYLKQFPQEIQAAVKSYHAGESMPTGNPRAGFTQAVKQIAQKYGQDIGSPADDNTYAAKHKMLTGLASTAPGGIGGQVTYARTSLNHLGDVAEAATALDNSNGLGVAPLAHLFNNARGLTTEQSAKVQALKDRAGHYGQEITKYYAGSPGGEAERTAFLSSLSGANAPKELAAVLEAELELARGKITKTQATIDETMGPGNKHQVMTQAEQKDIARTEAAIAKLRGLPAPAGAPAGAAGAPSGPAPPRPGEIKDGYRFKGGNPADPHSWEPVK